MLLPGYCTECRKIKMVRASASSLALTGPRGGVVQGICDDCDSPPQTAATERRGAGRSKTAPRSLGRTSAYSLSSNAKRVACNPPASTIPVQDR
jgi:hypothetical protein